MKHTTIALFCIVIVLAQLPVPAAAQTPEVAEASIADLQKAMTDGKVTSQALVQAYLNRIQAFDTSGPRLNSMIHLNPNALRDAQTLDRERASKGPRGPLHGIPIILKDNFDTADMPTTAGTMALHGHVPPKDGFQVKKLRDAGAVILGKANLHELAAGIVTVSSAGGQTLNPYDPGRNPGGSSGGTAVAVAASFAAAGMGSDTCGSIRIPASHNNLVGLRQTKGMSGITGIVPLSVTQDVAGPLARTVSDLAIMLDVTIGEDPADPSTRLKPGQNRPSFTAALRPDALRDARIGVVEPLFGDATDDEDVRRTVRQAIEDMKQLNVTVVSLALPDLLRQLDGTAVIDFELREDLSRYLEQSGKPPVRSLKEIVDQGLYHAALDEILRRRLASKGRDSEEYRAALAKRSEVTQMILKVMDDNKLDALVYPPIRRKPTRIGEPQAGSNCQLSATTGFPAISVPAGFTSDGIPVGMELFGRPFDDARLVGFAYSLERALPRRRAPAQTPSLGNRATVSLTSWEATVTIAGRRIAGRFQFDPSTNVFQYTLSASGFRTGELLSATLHRAPKDQPGPAIHVLSNKPFAELSGRQQLAVSDRERLLAGELYLNVATPANVAGIVRIGLTPK